MNGDAKRRRAEDEASLWAARLDGGNMNDGDRAALAAWLEADPRHRESLARYRELSAQIDGHLGRRAGEPRRGVGPRLMPLLAAAAAIAILLMVFSGSPQNFETKAAERHIATLADGSRVEMNAQTSIALAFDRSERRVRLIRGEALFTVTKDAVRPFVVETSAGVVRVTGTVFNVRSLRDERLEVTVLEGRVRVRGGEANVGDTALTPGAQAVIDGGRLSVRELGEEAAQDIAAWRQGQVVFQDTPLAEAVERFATYHGRAIRVDPAAADLRLGGRHNLDDLAGFFSAVERVLPARVSHESSGAVRISAAGGH